MAISPVTSTSSGGDKNDATWIVRSGLANSACLSFESAAAPPGQYLRHAAFQLHTAASNATTLFNQDATFCLQAGHSGQGYSFQSVNYPQPVPAPLLLRRLPRGGTGVGGNTWDSDALWSDDTSWLPAQPWS